MFTATLSAHRTSRLFAWYVLTDRLTDFTLDYPKVVDFKVTAGIDFNMSKAMSVFVADWMVVG